MIIDDDKDITDLFAIYLENNGYIVNAYINSLEAINNFSKNSYDLILLDLKMPKMNGMILYEKLQNIDPTILFCFITADKEYIEHLKKNNPDIEKIVIYKPILLNELRSKIHILLTKQQQVKKLLTVLWLINRI